MLMAKHRDEEWLREQYVENGLTQQEMADEVGCGQHTISRWLRRHGIDTRHKSDYQHHATIRMNDKGYYIARCQAGDSDDRFYLHRLTAVAEYGFDEVVGNDVHHVNGCTWDNRPENLTPVDSGDHAKLHRMDEERRGERFEERFN